MPLYLIEASIRNPALDEIQSALDRIAAAAIQHQGELIEAQIGEDLQRIFIILEAPGLDIAERAVAQSRERSAELQIYLVKQVRLIGQDLATVRSRKGKANYLVEWNLPAGLTMEAYLKRKAEKSPLYALVPEVKFERTYVCEDLDKCLCFYDSPDESTVKQAREAVGAPIDTLTPIHNLQ